MRKALSILSIIVAASLFNTMVFAAVLNDEVTSVKLKEADGLASQDTNTGSGVKTGHIQNSAVTTAKIADSAVTTVKILDSAVTSTKIANGAVTDAKISGLISASKISYTGLNADTVDGQHASAFAAASHTQAMSTVSGLDAALAGKSDVTHNHDILYQQKYGKIAVVAQSGGDYMDPVAAMNNVAAWCGTPSATNRCLLKIQPGVYDLAGGSLLTQQYVDVEGAGENVTLIKSNSFVVQSIDNVEVRFLTVESTGGVSNSNAIYVIGSGRLTHVTTRASGGTAYNIGINIQMGSPILSDVTVDLQEAPTNNWGVVTGMYSNTVNMRNVLITVGNGPVNYGMGANGGTTIMNNVSINVFGGTSIGIWGAGAALSITNSSITSDTTGIAAEGGPTTIQHSSIKGGQSSFTASSSVDVRLAGSQFDGVFNPTSNFKCINIYDGNFLPITCH